MFHFHMVDIDAEASLFELRKRASPNAMPPGSDNRGKIPPEYMRQPLEFYYSFYGSNEMISLANDADLKLAIFDTQSHRDSRRMLHIVHVLADIGFFLTSDITNEGSLIKGLSMVHELFTSMSSFAPQALHDIVADSPLLINLMDVLLKSLTKPHIGLHVLKLISVFTENTQDPDGELGGSFGALMSRSCFGLNDKTPGILENALAYSTKLIRRARLTPNYGLHLQASEELTLSLIANMCRMRPTLHVLASATGLELIVLLCSSTDRHIRDVALSTLCYIIQRHDGIIAMQHLLDGKGEGGTKADSKTGAGIIEMFFDLLRQAKSDRIDAVELMSKKGKSKKKKYKRGLKTTKPGGPSTSLSKEVSISGGLPVLMAPGEESSSSDTPGLDMYNRSYSTTKSILLALSLMARRNPHLALFKDGLICKHLITFAQEVCIVNVAAAETIAYYSQINTASAEPAELVNKRTKRRETFSKEWPRLFHACKSSGLAKKVLWEEKCVERGHEEREEHALEAQLKGRIENLYRELENVKNGVKRPTSTSEGTDGGSPDKPPQSVATVMESIATAEAELHGAKQSHSRRHTAWQDEIAAWDKATPLHNVETAHPSADLWKEESHKRHVFLRYSMLALWASSYCYDHDFAIEWLSDGFNTGGGAAAASDNPATVALNDSHFKVRRTERVVGEFVGASLFVL